MPTAGTAKMKMVALALAALCVAAPAHAAAPRAESLVGGAQVTLGDVFEGVAENAGYPLAPAPAPGETLVLNAADLRRIAQAFRLDWSPAAGPRQTVIRRDVAEIGAPEITAALQERLSAELKGRKLEIELAGGANSLLVPADAAKDLLVEKLSFSAARGDLRATVSSGGARKEVTGKFHLLARVPVLKEPLRGGEVVAASDIDYIEVRAGEIAAATILDAARLSGQEARRNLPALKPLAAADVKPPLLVKKGDLVTMLLKNDALSLTAQGKALSNGAGGDAITVMNTASKQVVDAIVTGPQAVSIRPPANVF